MGRHDVLEDKGLVYTKSGTALTTSYTFGDAQSTGTATRISLFVLLTEGGASSMSTAEVKLQVKDKLGNYYDVLTTQNDASGTTTNAQSLASTGSTTNYYLLQSENISATNGWRIAGKSTGATATGDSLLVYAVVM
jgi:hypothetical protein